MKTIGLIGGMSWESSAIYYDLVNKKVKELLGGFHSCQSLMYTVEFAEIEKLQREGNWEKLDELMANAAQRLYNGGADIIVLCTNTMHLCSEAIKQAVPVPFLHIADATGEAIKTQGLKKVALLGTKFTMEKDFYKDILLDQYHIDTIIPNSDDREEIHRIIYQELVLGVIEESSKKTLIEVIKKLQEKGAEGVVLGCTELPMLEPENHVEIPVFNTTHIHAEKAVKWSIH